MVEKRRNKRLKLDVLVEMERLDENGITMREYIPMEVTDISRSGIGFTAHRELKMGTYYDARIQIWTGEVVDAVIEIVRSTKSADCFKYGGAFIGMSDEDALKIDVYQIFNEE